MAVKLDYWEKIPAMPNKHGIKHVWQAEFDSFNQAIETVSKGKYTWSSRESLSSNPSWTSCKDYKEALNFAEFGWKPGLDKLVAVEKIMAPYARLAPHHGYTYDVGGYLPDVPLFISGNPEHMIVMKEDVRQKKKLITFDIDVIHVCHATKDEIANRGAAIMSIIEELETLGFSVDAYATYDTSNRNNDHCLLRIKIPIKKAGYQLERDRLAFALINAGFGRHMLFAIMEQSPKEVENWHTYSYGSCEEKTNRYFREVSMSTNGVYFPEMWTDSRNDRVKFNSKNTPKQIVDFLHEQIAISLGFTSWMDLVEKVI